MKTGDSIKIICYSHTKPKWTFVHFKHLVYSLLKKKNVFGNLIYIKHASPDFNRGIYTCEGTRKSGESFKANSAVEVVCK